MLNIILVANTQERARRLLRELWENNEYTWIKGYPTILSDADKTFQISAFSKYSIEAIKSLRADQLFLEDSITMTQTESFWIANTLRYSCVPVDFQIFRLSENY